MADLQSFPVARRWPAKHPERIQLYSFPTPNGVKISIALEELGLSYEAHLVNILNNETRTDDFLALNPNGKIPAIIDPDGPGGKPIALFESGAILVYLADKTGKLMPADPAQRYDTLQWLFFQMASIGPMFGQFGFFHRFGGRDIQDRRPFERYRDEAKRLLGVLEMRFADRDWVMGREMTIADIAMIGWVRVLNTFYAAADVLGLESYPKTMAWVERMMARPAVERGFNIPPRP